MVIKNPIVVEILPEVKKFEERENVVLGIGRIVPQKNFLLLIKAWQKVCDDFPEYVLHIYGEKTYKNGMFAAEIEKYILQNKLEKKVYLKGFSNSIYNVLNNSKLYISSSDYEGMSNVIIEALAMGVPTIATDCPIGGSREIIKNGVNGFLVPVNDIEMMSNMIRRVLNNTKLQKDISSEAIKIKKELSIDIICDEWENILKETF